MQSIAGSMSAETHARGNIHAISDDAFEDARADVSAVDKKTRSSRAVGLLFTLLVIASVYLGWRSSPEDHLTAESGLGYALGIVGASLMLLMLSYSARKRMRFMRRWGALRHWFRAHMICGIVAPVCILYHANFGLGSFNSNVALGSMMLVAASGLVGRFIYMKIHHGLYGARATLETLGRESARTIRQLGEIFPFASNLQERLQLAERSAQNHPQGYLPGIGHIMWMGVWTRWHEILLSRSVMRALDEAAHREGWSRDRQRRLKRHAKDFISSHLASCRKVASLNLFDRLFALWHVVHIPFFAMMVISTIVHIIAVHLY